MISVEKYFRAFGRILIVAALALAAFAIAPESAAQYQSLAVGVEVGSPSAVTVLIPTNHRYVYEILGAWDLNDFLFLNAHALVTKSVDDHPELHAIWGVGVFAGIRDNRSNNLSVGVSGKFGAGYSIDPFEIYVHLTPRFAVLSQTDFDLGGGLGLRFFTGRRSK